MMRLWLRQPDSDQHRCEIEQHPLFPSTRGVISDEEGPDPPCVVKEMYEYVP
jgi:hypothetical protein